MTVAVLAEKPSVARDLARALGCHQRGEGYLHGGGYVVTWAVGHLVALAQPHEIDPAWQRWQAADLPILPPRWPLVPVASTRDQLDVVRRILASPKVSRLICATDAGREGELIFRYIYEACGCDKPFERLWISSLTPDAIRAGFAALRRGAAFDALAAAARARSRADWLVGINLSRAYSLAFDDALSVGRVQTPTLAMVVERELAIRAFVPEAYREVIATFAPHGGAATYEGTWFRPRPGEPPRGGSAASVSPEQRRLPGDGEEALAICARVEAGRASVERIVRQEKRLPPPLLYDLTELQRHANRLFGMSAKRTLDVAQELYERHKLISYPRTDSRHLSASVAAALSDVVPAVAARYPGSVAPGTGARPLPRRFVDDARVTDHHAIIPTGVPASSGALGSDAARIYDLVCRRLLAAWHGDYVWSSTTVVTRVDPAPDRFVSVGTSTLDRGWKVLDVGGRGPAAEHELPALAEGDPCEVRAARAVEKATQPPERFTDATLLTAMETAGRALDDRELSDAMRERGLGTPATRAAIVEALLAREYLVRDGKSLAPTEKGIALVSAVHPRAKSPAMTGDWEHKLRRMERGELPFDAFMADIAAYVHEVVGEVLRAAPKAPAPAPVERKAPDPPRTLDEILRARFGFDAFRPHQEAVCRAVAEGRDVLLVMPTGAGKSLCYQLPGVARGGTTLVISPLVALMEDQVAKLAAQGFAAERIHAGRGAEASRDVVRAYLGGRLDFLFVAPERLALPGFAGLLAKRAPTLIAVDEAHCISQWGHDFRPDYRAIGPRLAALRDVPIIALTATATRAVQADIAAQLGLVDEARFIHGFRRTNIAIEVAEVPVGDRLDQVERLLRRRGRTPAIVYAPTRKETERYADALASRRLSAAAYHAGLPPAERESVQARFLSGEIDAVVATVAFGMGIDKPDVRTVVHVALPGSLEGYYQEIGRAGRDGRPSSALLLHSYADRRTHEFFFERDYPAMPLMKRLYAALPKRPRPLADVMAAAPAELRDEDDFGRALAKLRLHGGAREEGDGVVVRGDPAWEAGYARSRAHREEQLELVSLFVRDPGCRMARLLAHFGDPDDAACGLCDGCRPEAQRVVVSRGADDYAPDVLRALAAAASLPTGRLYKAAFPDERLDRREFEGLLATLARAGAVAVVEESFESEGKTIHFRRATITPRGLAALDGRREAGPPRRAPAPPAKRKGPKKKRRKARPAGAKLGPRRR